MDTCYFVLIARIYTSHGNDATIPESYYTYFGVLIIRGVRGLHIRFLQNEWETRYTDFSLLPAKVTTIIARIQYTTIRNPQQLELNCCIVHNFRLNKLASLIYGGFILSDNRYWSHTKVFPQL